ncbi:hypothetical protein HDU83_006937 [Entophlyctis luteolus]|nr:hypothetical protein HDU82_001163 [Entophlyctis luteolus]KAJ3340701.1 hypothetical protein HDU83_006937 [Entophlyctis luteolus]
MTKGSEPPASFTDDEVANIAFKLKLRGDSRPQKLSKRSGSTPSLNTTASQGCTESKNSALESFFAIFPDVAAHHGRSVIDRSADIVARAGLLPGPGGSDPVLYVAVGAEIMLHSGEKYPRRRQIGTEVLRKDEYFRDPRYCYVVRCLLYNEFRMHYKHTIKSVLLDCNYSYPEARKTLESIPPSKIWTLLSFMARPLTPIPDALLAHPDIIADRAFIEAKEREQQAAADEIFARELNNKEYEDTQQVIECPLCCSDRAFEDFVLCKRGCMQCRFCLVNTVRTGLYDSGTLRNGQAIVCGMDTSNEINRVNGNNSNTKCGNDNNNKNGKPYKNFGLCDSEFDDAVLIRVLGEDLMRAHHGFVYGRLMREAFGDLSVVCSACGYGGTCLHFRSSGSP